MARKCFYSFHYSPDSWRVSTVRNIGKIEGNSPASDNDWESIKSNGDEAIKQWINNQMKERSCTVVLIGKDTADRKWIKYEIEKSWNDGKGVVGIHIHGLKNKDGKVSTKGKNPFSSLNYGDAGKKLSSIVKCYDPQGSNSKERYDWLVKHLADVVEEAVKIRKEN